MVNNPELINKMINNINKLDDEIIKEAIQEVENEDMEEDIKNDLAGIAFSHPFFSDIVTGVLNYIKKLEAEVESQDKTIDKLVEEQEEREKYTHSLVEENESLVRQYEYQGALMVNEYFSKEQVFKHFIPISVIQNKIDELKKTIEEEDYEKLEYPIVEADIVISALQELLEERR